MTVQRRNMYLTRKSSPPATCMHLVVFSTLYIPRALLRSVITVPLARYAQMSTTFFDLPAWKPGTLTSKVSDIPPALFKCINTLMLTRVIVDLLSNLITRHPRSRPTPDSLPSNSFFNSLPISTLNFLERSNFASKPREEKIAFMKGLGGVLPRFSRGLRERKILGALLEEVSLRRCVWP
jgi:hypothetical protein